MSNIMFLHMTKEFHSDVFAEIATNCYICNTDTCKLTHSFAVFMDEIPASLYCLLLSSKKFEDIPDIRASTYIDKPTIQIFYNIKLPTDLVTSKKFNAKNRLILCKSCCFELVKTCYSHGLKKWINKHENTLIEMKS